MVSTPAMEEMDVDDEDNSIEILEDYDEDNSVEILEDHGDEDDNSVEILGDYQRCPKTRQKCPLYSVFI